MNFKQWISEAYSNREIPSNQDIEIVYLKGEDDNVIKQMSQIQKKVSVYPFLKHVSIIAKVGEEIIGGIYSRFYDKKEGRMLDFDVMVDPQWQGYQNVGPRLIDAVVQLAHNNNCNRIEALVVNARLVNLLKRKGFQEGLSILPFRQKTEYISMYRDL